LMKKFGQTVYTVAYKGAIKAFHWHKKQDDIWFVATGKALVVLHDLREDSPTKGQTETLYAGQDDYKVILIPIGVAHGYKVLSDEPVLVFYHVTETYDADDPDEQRIAYNDKAINFDWSKYNCLTELLHQIVIIPDNFHQKTLFLIWVIGIRYIRMNLKFLYFYSFYHRYSNK